MRILIPTKRSDLIGGKESYVRDLAVGLGRRGHQVAVLSEMDDKGIRSMTSEGIVVCENLATVPFEPDIIHGQIILQTLMALTVYTRAPAIYQVHSAGPLGNPLKHPRIYRYGGMTESIVARVAIEQGIPLSSTVVIRNSIDLRRFPILRAPAPRPTRALFYNSYHRPGSDTYEAVRTAVVTSGLSLDSIGVPFGKRVENPERVLPDYDLVFAAGVSAMEALSCGCAVVILGMTSCGPLVDPDNLDRFLASNFALPFNAARVDEGAVKAEIGRYNADACAAVTHRVRAVCDGEAMLDLVMEVYEDVIEEHRRRRPPEDEERAAVATLLRRLTPLVRSVDSRILWSEMPLTRARAIEMCRASLLQLSKAENS